LRGIGTSLGENPLDLLYQVFGMSADSAYIPRHPVPR
jgi:hypothetical protein